MLQAVIAHRPALSEVPTAPVRKINQVGSDSRYQRKYVFTAQIDERIREIYLAHPVRRRGPALGSWLSRSAPHWALKKRARELGVARTKEKPWSEPELVILARYAWMSDERIRLKLKAVGYARTATGIHMKLKRMRFKCDSSFYSGKFWRELLGLTPMWSRAGLRADTWRPVSRNWTGRAAGRRFLSHPRERCAPLYPRTPYRD